MQTLEQRDNLRTLANYLRSLPYDYEHFNMRTFHKDEHGKDRVLADLEACEVTKFDCGTVACAIGHGPAAGIEANASGWYDYCREAFGVEFEQPDAEFMFGIHWAEYEPHHWQAAERIGYWLEHGAIAYVRMEQPLPMAKNGHDDIAASVKQE